MYSVDFKLRAKLVEECARLDSELWRIYSAVCSNSYSQAKADAAFDQAIKQWESNHKDLDRLDKLMEETADIDRHSRRISESGFDLLFSNNNCLDEEIEITNEDIIELTHQRR